MKSIEGINMKSLIIVLCIFNIAASLPWSKDPKTGEEVEIVDWSKDTKTGKEVEIVDWSKDTNTGEEVEIVDGDDIDISKVPYMVVLLNSGQQQCGGSVINKNFILTAAHCVGKGDYSIRAGSNKWSTGGIEVKVVDIIIHPQFIGSTEIIDFDVAILKLEKPLKFGKDIAPAKLADKTYEVTDGENVLITGWGKSQNGFPEQLQGVELPKLNFEECKKMMAFLFHVTLTKNFICALHPDGGHNACPGDSGGPMSHNGIQIGVASYGGPCHNPAAPIAYALVAAHRDWIDSNSKL